MVTLQWRHNEHDSVSNHQPRDCFLNRLFGRRSKKTSKLRVTGLCVGNSEGTGEFPALMASNAENFFIWWRHHEANTKKTTGYNYLVLFLSWNIPASCRTRGARNHWHMSRFRDCGAAPQWLKNLTYCRIRRLGQDRLALGLSYDFHLWHRTVELLDTTSGIHSRYLWINTSHVLK